MLEKEEEFDIGEFICDSLSLHGQSPTRNCFSENGKDKSINLFNLDPIEALGEIFEGPKLIDENVIGTPIQEGLRGLNVFITGGTGFLGKILIDKLLRSVPHIGHIYVLIREKKGITSEARFEKLLEDRVFLRLKTEVPSFKEKISHVEGDMLMNNLGLADTDRLMLENNVNVVFNSAADVRFLEPLRSAMESNVFGSQRVLKLAKNMTNLKCFLHVSTAYSQCVQRRIKEEVPKLPVNYREIIQLVKLKTDAELEAEQVTITQGWPNTYTFSKAVCEEMLVEEGKGLPLCIFRPSVVTCSYWEPVRGWTDNLYGPIAMFVAIGHGVLHSWKINLEMHLDVVPVDYTVNCMIAIAWKTKEMRTDALTVYNFSSSPEQQCTWKAADKAAGKKYRDLWPYSNAVYIPSFIPLNNATLDNIFHILLHKIPGKIIDCICFCVGSKVRLSRIFDKIDNLKDNLNWFSERVWEFEKENVKTLWGSLSKEDRQLFNFDMSDVDFTLLVLLGKLGVRYYYLKDKMETLPFAYKKNTCLRWIHGGVKIGFGFVVLKSLAYISHLIPI